MMENHINRMYELDVLRGIAVLAVVLFHYTTRYDELFGHAKENYILDFKYGFFGVQLFFIISGFVIYMTLVKSKNGYEFAFKRVTRLYPAYIFCVMLTYLIVTLYGLEGREVSFSEALFNFTMLQGYFPFIDHVDGAYWSLTVEMSFYFITGILLFIGLIKRIVIVSISWLIVASIFNIIDVNFYIHYIVFKLGIFDYCNLFIAGMIFYHLREKKKLIYHILLISTLLYEFTFNGVVSGLFVFSFMFIFYMLIYDKLKFINNNVLKYFGTISYSLYLVHQNIGYVVINYMEKQGFISELYLLIPFGMSIMLATLITFYVEKPLQKYLRNKYIIKHNDRVIRQNKKVVA